MNFIFYDESGKYFVTVYLDPKTAYRLQFTMQKKNGVYIAITPSLIPMAIENAEYEEIVGRCILDLEDMGTTEDDENGTEN